MSASKGPSDASDGSLETTVPEGVSVTHSLDDLDKSYLAPLRKG